MSTAATPNKLSFDVEHKDSKAIVHCRGRLVAGMGNEFYTRVHALFAAHTCVVLDLTEMTYVDSMGLGTLVRLLVSAKSAGSRLELINLGKQIRELLGITNLLSLFGDMCEKGVAMKF